MIKTILALGLLAGSTFALPAYAQEGVAAPALWQVQDEDATVFLFGTYHLLPTTLDWRTQAFETAFASADTLWLEIDIETEEGQSALQNAVFEVGLYPRGETLFDHLDAQTTSSLNDAADAIGLPPEALEPMRPWLAALSIAAAQFENLDYQVDAGVDTQLAAQARDMGMDVAYLETADDQMRALGDHPPAVQMAMLEWTLEEIDQGPETIATLTDAWLSGDEQALDTAVNDDLRVDFPTLYDTLIVDRNTGWTPQIEAMLEQGGIHFVAAGAGHFVGPDSVVAMLEARGHTVERYARR